MNINGIETQYQNYTFGTSSTKSSSSESTFTSFQQEMMNWAKRIKEANDKERENDNNGSILMSEKHWNNLMKKVDNALDVYKDNKKEQEQEEKNSWKKMNLIQKATVADSVQTHKTTI